MDAIDELIVEEAVAALREDRDHALVYTYDYDEARR